MISRRGFLKTLAGIAPILGGAGLCLSSPLWERLFSGGDAGCLFALDPKSDLVRLAPPGALLDIRSPRRRRLPVVPRLPGTPQRETPAA